MKLRAAIAGLAILAWAVPVRAGSVQLQPFQMVRSLQLVQDRVAAGDHAALPIQRKLLEMIDQRLRAATDEELADPAQLRALLIYSMSGGNPATLEALIGRMRLSEEDAHKAIGILSYLKGGTQAATIALEKVEPLKENPEVGAFLALVKGSVLAEEKPQDALKFLDQARLISPGTLVEEAALRRSIPLAVGQKDAERFLLASEQYVRSFLRSPYASQFADTFVSGVIDLHATLDLTHLENIIDQMSPEQQQVIYLRIARRSAIDGLTALSQFASERVALVSAPATVESDPRALLYATLANVATVPLDQLQANLKRIDRARLSAGDLKLLDAVTAVGDQMTTPPPVAEVPDQEPGPEKEASAAKEPSAEAAPMDPSIPEAQPGPETAAAPLPQEAPGPSAPQPEAQAAPAPAPVPAPSPEVAAAPAPQPPPTTDLAPLPTPTPTSEAATSPETAPALAEAANPASQDPAEIVLAEGRKKLGEIDDLLAKATK